MASHRMIGAAALLLVLGACSSQDNGADEPAQRGHAAPSPSESGSTSPPAATQLPGSLEPDPEPSRSAAPSPTRSADDRRGDPVHGFRTLVGTVEAVVAPCPVLRVGGERWSLLGDGARGLAPGGRFEVRGTVTAPPRGCRTTRALRVSVVVRR